LQDKGPRSENILQNPRTLGGISLSYSKLLPPRMQ